MLAQDLMRFGIIYFIFLMGFGQAYYLIFMSYETPGKEIVATNRYKTLFSLKMITQWILLLRAFCKWVEIFGECRRKRWNLSVKCRCLS